MYLCNPVNLDYKYQFFGAADPAHPIVYREAADPTMVVWKDRYLLFPSMSLGFYVSDDLTSWKWHALPKTLPLYDYAPDVRIVGDWLYFCASKGDENCSFYRTKDPLQDQWEEVDGSFPFWDPNLFQDDDGRVYLYWGCSSADPLYGIELDATTMQPIGEKTALLSANETNYGYERTGDNHVAPYTEAEIDMRMQGLAKMRGIDLSVLPKEAIAYFRRRVGNAPYIEGAYVNKHDGRYYLQYAFAGTQYNIYGDGVYVSGSPLGPFVPADNNPYSYKPGGFICGAGHGSTFCDPQGNWWHISTGAVSVNYQFERRLGLWRAGFDQDGELFCNQRYGDWVLPVPVGRCDPWEEPAWMLLSYQKPVTASSSQEGHGPLLAVNESIKDWWRADTAAPSSITLDLEHLCDVHAVQINFADEGITAGLPAGETMQGEITQRRWISRDSGPLCWLLEYSADGNDWSVLCDKRKTDESLPHDLVIPKEPVSLRYLRLTVTRMPFDQPAAVSGLRVFGLPADAKTDNSAAARDMQKPQRAAFAVTRLNGTNALFNMNAEGAIGYNVIWGSSPEKLYHSYLTYENELEIGALVAGKDYFCRVDSFNEYGITHGDVIKLNA